MTNLDFLSRAHDAMDEHSSFCWGLDPSDEVLASFEADKPEDRLRSFCKKVLEILNKEKLAMVKPQSAFFERFGTEGMISLGILIGELREMGILVLLDGKRGDIASTNQAYAQAYFSDNSPMRIDALTTHPFLGFKDLNPFFDMADKANGMVFVVVASSNSSGRKIQSARIDNHNIVEWLAEKIANISVAGAVIGATRDDIDVEVLDSFGDSLLLCPGIGAQGADFSAFERFPHKRNIIPTASRSIFQQKNWLDGLKDYKDKASALRARD